MSAHRTPGPVCAATKTADLNDGTSSRTLSPIPGQKENWHLRQYFRRASYVLEAWKRGVDEFAMRAIIRRCGRDYYEIMKELLPTLSVAAGAFIANIVLGILFGGALGGLVGGVAAAPGAVMGAKVGFVFGVFILNLFGVAFLLPLIRSKLGEVGDQLRQGIVKAWESEGAKMVIEDAGRDMAEALALFYQHFLEALVRYLNDNAEFGDMVVAMRKLRGSRLFRICSKLEPWLVRNFGEFRAKYIKLDWRVLAHGPPIEGSSIPSWLRLLVGKRQFLVERNAEKKGPDDAPIGPATKHLAEKGEKASSWSKLSETDFPISALAAALDAAEAELIFKGPQPRAQPNVEGWDLLIDTRPAVWKVFHAVPTSEPSRRPGWRHRPKRT